jgi:replicative DNA helicase
MLHSPELEKQLLAYLIRQPEAFVSICHFISEKDFYSKDSQINACIFTIIRHAAENAQEIDDVIIAQRITDLGLSFEDNISVVAVSYTHLTLPTT